MVSVVGRHLFYGDAHTDLDELGTSYGFLQTLQFSTTKCGVFADPLHVASKLVLFYRLNHRLSFLIVDALPK